jgi:arylsulfatase A-like enzyme
MPAERLGRARSRSARTSATGCSATLLVPLVLSIQAVACSRAEYDLKRPFEQDTDLVIEYGQVGDTTRPFVRFLPGSEGATEIALGPVRRGFLRTYLALDRGAGVASAELELRGEGLFSETLGDGANTCGHQWQSTAEQRSWEECLLPIRRDYRNATLRIRLESPRGAGLRVSSPILVAADAPPKANVFVIVLDTARADALTTFNERVPIGARLDALARDSIVFDELRAPSSWTRASVATLITGLSQTRHQVFDRLHPLSSRLVTLQSHLQKNGYLTLAWSTNPNILPIWGFADGFDMFVDAGAPNWQRKKADASEVFALVRARLKANRDATAFYYLHFMDPHSPYLPPRANLRKVKNLSRRHPQIFPVPILATVRGAGDRLDYQRYLAEIHDFDAKIGSFFDFLKEIRQYESSLILLVSDHGEEFLDHGDRYHGQNLYEESLRVPGFLKLPGNERAGTRIERAVGLADLLPTITSGLGLSTPPGIEGNDVLGPEWPVLPQVAELILDDRRMATIKYRGWKLIVDYLTGDLELYDLVDDPTEKRNLAEEQEEKVRELRELLDRMTALHAVGWHFRGCGCDEQSVLRMQIRAEGAEATGIEFEEGDAVLPLDRVGGFDVTFDLAPTVTRQERFDRAISAILRDEDEIALHRADSEGADVRLSIRPGTAEGLTYALGNGGHRHLGGWLDLSTVVDASEIEVGEPANCRPPLPAPAASPPGDEETTCQPYVRIWYVAPPQAVSESTIDPSIGERLKALGYTW